VHLHNPVLAYENGDDFLKYLVHLAEKGKLDPFVLVVEGSIPNEKIKKEGYWAALGTDPQPASPSPPTSGSTAGAQGSGRRRLRHLRHLRRHSRHGRQSHRAHGPGRLSGLGLASKAGLPIVNVPGCPVQPDNFMETVLYLLYQVAGLAPMIPLDDQLRPTWLFGKTVHEGCDRAGYYEQGDFATEYGSPKCIVKLGCWGPVVNCNVPQARLDGGIGGCPNVGGICIGCTMPGFPDKFMPFMDEPPGAQVSSARSAPTARHSRAALVHQSHRQQRAEVAASARRTDHRLPPRSITEASRRSA
jgi:hydrogenase small subunit